MNEESGHRDAVEAPFSDLEREQAKLGQDIDVVRRYGETHFDAFVDLWLEHEPEVRIVAAFAGDDVDEHDAALRRLVSYPSQLEVRGTRYDRTHLEGIHAEVRRMATAAERGSIKSTGIVKGHVKISLRANQLKLAQDLLDSYGDAVQLTVGFLGYPDPNWFDPDVPARSRVAPRRSRLLPDEIHVSIDEGLTVKTGEHLRSVVHIHNAGPTEMVVLTNGAVTAYIVDPQSEVVVGAFEFAQTTPGIEFRIPPGGVIDVPLLVGTASSDPLLGYATPPGRWAIEIQLNLENRGIFRTPPLPFDVVAWDPLI